LNNGGTEFCQGLTIVVDDVEGRLPLNPTKTDFAFGERASGETHRQNLKMWIAAATTAYWRYHYKKSYEKKAILTDRVRTLKEEAESHINNHDAQAPINVKSIGECQFKFIDNLKYKFWNNKVMPRSYVLSVYRGKDSIMELPPPPSRYSLESAPGYRGLSQESPPSYNHSPYPDGTVSSHGYSAAAAAGKRKREPDAAAPAWSEHHRHGAPFTAASGSGQVYDLTLSDSDDQLKMPAQPSATSNQQEDDDDDFIDDGDDEDDRGGGTTRRRGRPPSAAKVKKLTDDLKREKKKNAELKQECDLASAEAKRLRADRDRILQQANDINKRKELYKKENEKLKAEKEALARQVEVLRLEKEQYKNLCKQLQDDNDELQRMNNFLKESNIEEAAEI